MSNVDGGTILMIALGLLMAQSFIVLAFLVVNKLLFKQQFIRFLGILTIGSVSSLFPLGPLGLFFGFPSILISSILVSLFLDREY